jgi:hypothetical protein
MPILRYFLTAFCTVGALSAATLQHKTPVPEISTYTLAGIGLLALCILLRRKLHLPPKG